MNCPSCRAENDGTAASCSRCGTALAGPPTLSDASTQVIVTVDLRPGVVFDSRYEILGALGQGGMGMVYKARDRSLDEVVAIKVLRPDFARDPRMAERFKSEIRLARRVRHRNVCAIHDYGEDRGLLYISMEYIEGVDLKRLLRDRGAYGTEEAYEVAIQIAEGLHAVHEAGIIHRDLKTPNIMRDGSGVARLMDFGIAKREGEGTATATGHIVGTPEYMSPEQAQGHRVDFRSDIYALGIVVYEIFTGRVPFKGETPISTILKHLHDPPPLEPPDAQEIPPAVRTVLARCLAKDPARRFATAREVAEALRDAHSPSRRQQPMPTTALRAPTIDSPTLAAPARPAAPVRRGTLMQPWLLAIPIVAVAAGVVVFGGWLTGQRRTAAALPAPATPALSATTTLPALAIAPPATSEPPVPVTMAAAHAATPKPTPTRPPRAVETPGRPPATAAAALAPPLAVAATTLAPEPGLLQLAVRPWGEVSIDGRVVGTTPLDRITLAPGAHVLRVRHPLYETWERPVTIRPGQTEKIVIDLPAEGVRKQP